MGYDLFLYRDFAQKSYGLWVMDANSLQTNLGNPKTYGLLGSMGYMGYGLQGS